METNETSRGFLRGEFVDANGVRCSMQESSIAADEGHLWLGCNEIGLKKFIPYKGWEDVPLENDAPYGIIHIANTRMHLSQSQIRDMLPALTYFAEYGELPARTETAQQRPNATETDVNETGH